MYRLFLAIRYVWARPISWVSMIGIWLSVTALICTFAIMTGFLREMEQVIRGTTSDIILTPHQQWLPPNTVLAPPAFGRVQAALGDLDGVAGMSAHMLRPALLAAPGDDPAAEIRISAEDAVFVQAIGLDPAREKSVTAVDRYLREPRNKDLRVADPDDPFARSAGQSLPTALVGEALAEEEEIARGDVIALVTLPENLEGEQLKTLSARFVVGGVVRTGHFPQDKRSVYLELEAARAFAGTPGATTEISLRAAPGQDVDRLAARICERLLVTGLSEAVRVETWRGRNARELASIENQRSILVFILAFYVLVACFNIFATLTILVSDKTKDIGVLSAMGATRHGVGSIFVVSALLMTLCAGSAGCLTGILVARNINLLNEGIEALTGERIFNETVYHFDEIPVAIDPDFVALLFAGTMLLAVLSAFLPARRAARMDPVKSLRYE